MDRLGYLLFCQAMAGNICNRTRHARDLETTPPVNLAWGKLVGVLANIGPAVRSCSWDDNMDFGRQQYVFPQIAYCYLDSTMIFQETMEKAIDYFSFSSRSFNKEIVSSRSFALAQSF